MSATTGDGDGRPLYGHWQKAPRKGFKSLGPFATGILGAAALVTIFISATSLFKAVLFALVVLVLFVPQVLQDADQRTYYAKWTDMLRFRWQSFRGRNIAVGGPLSGVPTAQCWVPGLGASIELYEGRDGLGNSVVLLHHPVPGHVSAVIECLPPGTALVDPATVDGWVANWGEWLADLGHEGGIAGLQVVVETRPDPGVELANAVEARLRPDAPAFARDTIRNVVAMMPAGAARTRVWVTITWARTRFESRRRRSINEVGVDIISQLPELCGRLGLTGAGQARPVSKGELAGAIRAAYDPAVLRHLDGTTDQVEWADAGPLTHRVAPLTYEHDNALSTTWVMGFPPSGAVRSNVLTRLMAPHRDVPLKRVTMLYRPHTAMNAAKIVEKGVTDADWRARQQKGLGRSRDVQNTRVARRMADDEALGAGLVRFSMIVTATTWSERGDLEENREALEKAISVIEQGNGTRIRFRRARAMQDTAFLAGLPLGLVLPAHVRQPISFRGE